MNKLESNSWAKWLIISLVVVFAIVISLIVIFSLAYSDGSVSNTSESSDTSSEISDVESCVGDECLTVEGVEYPVGELPGDVKTILDMAIDDEYKAYSTYEAVIGKLGQIRPFSMIIRAEESHIALLKALFDKYGESIPANPYPGNIVVADNKQQNCQIGFDAENTNVALYRDDLLSKAEKYPDIVSVFTKLMSDSRDKHLPAFDKCR